MKLLLTCPRGHRQEIAFRPGTGREWAETLVKLFSSKDVTAVCGGKGYSEHDRYCGEAVKAKVIDDGN
jgi:hypothetical protein